MKLNELLNCTPDIQGIMLMGDGITTNIKSNAETLTNVLNKDVLCMNITDIEAEGNVLKIWIEEETI